VRKSRGIYIDRGYVFIRIWPNGKINPPYRECFGPLNKENLADAEYRLREYRNQLRLKTFGIPETMKQLTIEDACSLYQQKHGSTLRDPKVPERVFRRIQALWKCRTIDTITFADVERYRAWRKSEGESESTINRQHVCITSLFSKLERWVKTKEIARVKLPEDNPGSLVSKVSESENTRRRALSVEEFERLMDNATPRGRDIYLMAVNSLLRKKDLVELQKELINQSTGEVRGLQSKTGKPYCVIITDPIAEILNRVESGPILDFANFQKEFNKARKDARIKDFEFRDLRRTGATRMLKDGVDLGTISQMLGHSSIQMTEHYIGIIKEDNKRAAELLARRFRTHKKNNSLESIKNDHTHESKISTS
jgi:integrase